MSPVQLPEGWDSVLCCTLKQLASGSFPQKGGDGLWDLGHANQCAGHPTVPGIHSHGGARSLCAVLGPPTGWLHSQAPT